MAQRDYGGTQVRDGFGQGGRVWRIAFVLLLVLVIAGSLVPPAAVARGSLIPDWVQHGISYGLLMATLLAGQVTRRYLASAAVLVTIGGALELIQGSLGYRAAEWRDLLADAVGVAAVGMGLALGTRFARQRNHAAVSESEG